MSQSELVGGGGGSGGTLIRLRTPEDVTSTQEGIAEYELTASEDGLEREYFQSSEETISVGVGETVDGNTALGVVAGSDPDSFRGEGPFTIENKGGYSVAGVTIPPTTIIVDVSGREVGSVAPGERKEFTQDDVPEEYQAYDEETSGESDGETGLPDSLGLLPAVGPLTSAQTTLAAGGFLLLGVLVLA